LQNSDSNAVVLDASAFYAGVPFLSSSKCYTTNLIFTEVKHIKKSYSALESLIDAGNLKIMEPEKSFLKKVTNIAQKTGDYSRLSSADISIIALATQLKITLISDDYAVQNTATLLGVHTKSIGTKGITKVGKWIAICYVCHKSYSPNIMECVLCGNKLRRRLKKFV
jgi:endoribonuclease Nob1